MSNSLISFDSEAVSILKRYCFEAEYGRVLPEEEQLLGGEVKKAFASLAFRVKGLMEELELAEQELAVLRTPVEGNQPTNIDWWLLQKGKTIFFSRYRVGEWVVLPDNRKAEVTGIEVKVEKDECVYYFIENRWWKEQEIRKQ